MILNNFMYRSIKENGQQTVRAARIMIVLPVFLKVNLTDLTNLTNLINRTGVLYIFHDCLPNFKPRKTLR